jgi:hypothetical protein
MKSINDQLNQVEEEHQRFKQKLRIFTFRQQ